MKNENYITIQGWMINDLSLSGNDLIVYAMIYGFSQDGESEYRGSMNYIASSLNLTRQGANKIVSRLVERGLIEKKETIINGVKFCSYKYIEKVAGCKQSLQVCKQSLQGGCKQSLHNNNSIDNNINNNSVYGTSSKLQVQKYSTTSAKVVNYEPKDYITNTNITNTNISVCDTHEKATKHLFRNSSIYQLADQANEDYSKFEALFANLPEVEKVDLVYYFWSVSDWSDSSNTRRTDTGWVATIRNFIRGDKEKGKLHLKSEYNPNKINMAEAIEFLKWGKEGDIKY